MIKYKKIFMIEYKIENIFSQSPKDLENKLNRMGKDNWELINIFNNMLIFKRYIIKVK